MKDGFRVIDADAHMQDELARWVDYVEPEYWDRRPRVEIIERGKLGKRAAVVLPCELFPEPQQSTGNAQGAGVIRGGRSQASDFIPKKYPDAYFDEWSAASRIRDMDRFGWDKMVCISSNATGSLGWSSVEGRDQGLLWAMARAWHNWCRDFCDTDPTRLYMVADMPNQHDVEGLVAETRRVIGVLNAVTVIMPKPPKDRPWEDPAYDPFFRLAEEMDFPVSFHGVRTADPHVGTRYQPRHLVPGQQVALEHTFAFPFENMLSLGHLIYMGVLERFPKMRASFLEGNAGWVPWWLARLDDHAVESRRQGMWFDAPLLPLAPSDYFRRQCYAACDGDEGSLAGVTYLGWEDNIVWNTDYPHVDAPDPDKALPSLLAQPISDEAKKKILWDNAIRLYGDRILS